MFELIVAGLIILAGFYSRMNQNKQLRETLSILPEICLVVIIASLINLLVSEKVVSFENYITDLQSYSAMKFAFIFVVVNYFKIRRKGASVQG
ncbi:MAG: putative membrane protein SirB2 [Spirosomataceae bacterium]|jgi:uncharacterized membrane protein SirB2